MHPARSLLAAFALVVLSATAQTADPVVRVFHPTPPLPTYEVATIKPYIYTAPVPGVMCCGDTVRELIRNAYYNGAGRLPPSQVVGGPAWIDKDNFQITSKPPAELDLAMQRMTFADKFRLDHAMLQSLLAERFHLKVHFEVRELPIYALIPAKGGLKIKQVAPPPPRDPANPLPPPATSQPPAPETFAIGTSAKGATTVRARAISMAKFIFMLSSNVNETGDRPVADQTGFTGYFDIDDLRWSPSDSANAANAPDAPSLETALEETLGIKLVSTKGPVEVVVIDSIDHPTEN